MTETSLTTEMSDSLIPTIDELREITERARKTHKGTKHGEVDLPENVVKHFIRSMEKDILDFASKGLYFVEWNYGAIENPPTRHQMSQLAREFKSKHPRLMIISSPTRMSASWKPKR